MRGVIMAGNATVLQRYPFDLFPTLYAEDAVVHSSYPDPAAAGNLFAPSGTRPNSRVTFSVAGADEYTVPEGAFRLLVECWGGGAGGNGGTDTPNGQLGGGGGGGGAYARSVVEVTPGEVYAVQVGAGGAGGVANVAGSFGAAGGDTSFGGGLVVADGGKVGVTKDVGGLGGLVSGCVGGWRFAGGNAGREFGFGGGGGAGAASYAAGDNAGSGPDQPGIGAGGGGDGGWGGYEDSMPGFAGVAPGGGGGGGDYGDPAGSTGGAGAVGRVIVTVVG